MEVKELLEKLEPLIGKQECTNWYNTYLQENPEGRKHIEQYLQLRLSDLAKQYDVLLLPPPPKNIAEKGTITLGKINYGNESYHFNLTETELLSHIAILGRSGSGKTNLTLHIIEQLINIKKPFWIFDFKRNYRDLLQKHKDIIVYTVGRNISNIALNPLIPTKDFENHIRQIAQIICKTYFLGEGAHSLIVKCLADLYKQFNIHVGNDQYPTFKNVQQWLETYKPASAARDGQWLQSTLRAIRMLNFGQLGKTFNHPNSIRVDDLLNQKIVFELDALTTQDKALFINILLHYRHECKLDTPVREKLQDVLIIEEAHHVLPRKAANEEETILELLLREERELGTSIIIIDQMASRLSDVAFANTATTIALNQKHKADINTIANAILLNTDDKKHLSKIPTGQAIIRQQDRWPKPFTIHIPHVPINKGNVKDEHLPKRTVVTTHESVELNENAITLLKHIQNNPLLTVVEHYKKLQFNHGKGNAAKTELLNEKLIYQKEFKTNTGKQILLQATKKGEFYLQLLAQEPFNRNTTSIEHKYFQHALAEKLKQIKTNIKIEPQLDNCRPDILVDDTIAIEIETGKSKRYIDHVKKHLAAQREIIICATNEQALQSIIQNLQQLKLYPHEHVRVIIPKL